MDVKVKELIDNLETKFGAIADDKLKAFATQELEAIKANVKETIEQKDKSIKELDERISDMEVAAKKAEKSNAKEVSNKSLGAAVVDVLKQNQELVKKAAERGGKASFDIETKAVGAMSRGASITGDIPQADRMAGVSLIATRTPRLLDFMTSSSTDRQKVDWVYEVAGEGDAGQTAEGAAKSQADIDYAVGEESIVKTTAFVKCTTELLDDWGELEALINNDLRKKILRKVEEGAFNGNGTAPNLRGVTTVATAASAAAGLGANTVNEANVADVIVSMITQIELAEQSIDNLTVFVNPKTLNQLRAIKIANGDNRYNDRLQFIGGSANIDGVPIVKTTLIGADEVLVGDMSKAELVQRAGLRFEIGEDADDFTTNRKTLLAEWRGAVVVRNNDRNCIVWASSIATMVANLDPDVTDV